ncbi:MAG TPA: hypothetical protein VM619_06575 [Luteimonas sp.]|nr:hypothetical protein [Luteimonas sp.]
MPTWPELESQLRALRDEAPAMLRDSADAAGFFDSFAGAGNVILERAPQHLSGFVYAELGAILRGMALIDDDED